ncbi:sensor histidine kinase NtrY-like [Cochlodiniinecator piscidefendens]|uniref:sensor histidine kinase NtrY-like n=1 Tax=Cochlodiniinecator piscidefendens TaxID=2715756 RepID=UPI001407C4AD|nr:PAS domain-containing sensor histidine kinase [Cochlodiniinecator piscidefendens]
MDRLVRLRRLRRLQNMSTLGLVLLGPILAIATFMVLGPFRPANNTNALRLVLLADFVYVLLVAALVLQRIARMIAARRVRSAGSRLHLRLTGVFTFVALIPTVLVAVFAMLTVNVGLEGWFSDRVRQVVGSSLAAAEAYKTEQSIALTADAAALADYVNLAQSANFIIPDGELRQVLETGQGLVQRGLREAFIIDGSGNIRARGERSYLFDFEMPSADSFDRAIEGETVVIEDWPINEFRALIMLSTFNDRFLYVTRDVDGEILNLLDDTQETVALYNQLESDRGRMLFEFGLLYLGFAVILVLAAIWLGLWFAERLARPVGRLAGAAQMVGSGDLDVQVVEEDGDDEIAMLGRLFNQMTRQLKGQRDALLENTDQIELRRRQFDSVLSSITAGVVGLDAEGTVTFVNRSAERLLDLPDENRRLQIGLAVPEFGALFDKLCEGSRNVAQEEIKLVRAGKLENLLVRMSTRRNEDGVLEGYVVAFDDVTDLVSAQRMAAWGDVAQRIAHEIKNPLTPIQLSAERLKRKFAPKVGDDAAVLEQYTDVIVRQTGDLRRIVDEFSKFARMPEPERRTHDLAQLLRDVVLLQDVGQSDVILTSDIPDSVFSAEVDATMISQALTNLIKNAGEATETLKGEAGYQPEVRVSLQMDENDAEIRICDNGIGLPADRAKLLEPYVTTRSEGTGLGLPIVKKIVEEHGGAFLLEDAEPFTENARVGAMMIIRLPNVTIQEEKE